MLSEIIMVPTLTLPLFLFSATINGLALLSSNPEPDYSSINSPSSITNTTSAFLHDLDHASPPSLRRRDSFSTRAINNCRSLTATFVHSHCIHSAGRHDSMQPYLVFCREEAGYQPHSRPRLSGGQPPPTPAAPRIPRPTAESGRCAQDEICVNGQAPGGWGNSMAWCVGKDDFVQVQDGSRRAIFGGAAEMGWRGWIASAVVSDVEGRTPIRVPEIDVAFGGGGSGVVANLTSESAGVKTQTCRDCFELITGELVSKTDQFSTDVKVAGTVAAAGVLWLAILSG